ncbi:hypothetical protein [Planctomicrobium piriforme]|uniref:Uncharacterized membrane protein n=1 Tax=Planctomicrobium piriforme TaxID=1576369 RepID=A0A1I3G4U5_9PLAN|nr:hypothetical protein [Planctomicrobium piriforme]SFI18454.1 Uncharacterized membrane protein [Planctomicrobium piriforme]
MRFLVEPVWSWPWIGVAAAAMLALVLLTYPPRVRSLPPRWRYTLIGLRLLTALVLIFAMLRPSIQIEETDKQHSEIAVLFDSSGSMNTPDGPGGLTRRESLLKTWQDNQSVLEALGKEIDLKLLDFAADLKPVVTPDKVADGKMTAIGKVLDELREQTRNDRLVGVLLLSDGAQRAGGEDDVDPLIAARRLSEERGVPINPVLFGTSELSTSGLDLSVEELILDQPVTFERKTVPVRMQVRLQGAAGKKVKVRLLMEDRTGKALGESGPLKPIPLSQDAKPFTELRTNENSVAMNVELSFIAEQPGDYKIAAEVVPEEGEIKLNNNLLETLVTVRKGGLRVAYFDTLRIEQKFLRELNDTAKIQLDTQFILGGQRGNPAALDPKLFEPGAYDVYLIGDLPADAFKVQGRDLLELLAARVREGAGLGMLGGSRNFGAGGYASSPLAELLPVRMSSTERLGPNDKTARNGIEHPLRMLPTRDGDRKYLMQLSTLQNDQTWRQLPEMSGANRLTPKSGAVEILAESEQQEPLLIVADTGKSRVLALGIDETWKWHLHGHAAEHQRFWQQVMLWLARKEFESDQPVWVRVEPRSFSPQSQVPIEMGAQDGQGNPIADAQYDVEVVTPDGKTEKVIPQRQPTGALAEFSKTSAPGDYWVRVNASKDGQALGISAMTRFVVDARDLELDNPSADPTLMSELAALTGGTVIPPENLTDFLNTLLKEGIPSEFKRTQRINLWDGWPLLLIFVGLMTLEWTLRKWKGLV